MSVHQFFSWPAEVQMEDNFVDNGNELSTLPLELCLEAENCFYVVLEGLTYLNDELEQRLVCLLRHSFFQSKVYRKSRFDYDSASHLVFEVGPRPSFITPFSTNAVSICRSSGLRCVVRLEKSVRYKLFAEDGQLVLKAKNKIMRQMHDRMIECEYTATCNLLTQPQREEYYDVDVIGSGRAAIEMFSKIYGLSLDDVDVTDFVDVFCATEQRNPTNVELFDLAQSNSEHCRHWFFKGALAVDGMLEKETLLEMVVKTQEHSNLNNVIKFCDNSSAVRGFQVAVLRPENGARSSVFRDQQVLAHILLTAETHNFPTGVCPFPGAATGVGGRIRDVHATGKGGYPIASAAGYSFGNLHIPGYVLNWERQKHNDCCSFASPLRVLIDASNGASDYGNKFGEPIICGFARSFDQWVHWLGERFGYVKPIMFTAGLGSIDSTNVRKDSPVNGVFIVKLGGPVFRVGMGGGAASSSKVQGECDNKRKALEFNAVQRGDPEMEQKLNRVIRACAELRTENPISSIHDQGAGGNGNVIKELVEPLGAELYADRFTLGDCSVSACELWTAEYQESDALLVAPDKVETIAKIAKRERCYCDIVGRVLNNDKIVLHGFEDGCKTKPPVNLRLSSIRRLASRQKVFRMKSVSIAPPLPTRKSLELPSIEQALSMVLRHPTVSSKRYLTNKVDRSVGGLVAQQQCVGPFHTPVADVGVVALSYFDKVGAAMAIGEQPVQMLLNPECGARMTVAESLTNLVFAPITDLKDVKCSANWMWAAKFSGEDYKMLTACKAMCQMMSSLGIAVDGGKDSLSMAADVAGDIVKAPGTLVVTSYAPCADIGNVVTPVLKAPTGQGTLIYVRFGSSLEKNRLGGSVLSQCFENLEQDSADVEDPDQFGRAFQVTQQLISEESGTALAGHDISDGGLVTCLLEMAFAGNCSVVVLLPSGSDPFEVLFAEETGVVLEVPSCKVDNLLRRYHASNVPAEKVGYTWEDKASEATIEIVFRDVCLLKGSLTTWRREWEETGYRIERMQCNPACADEELSRQYLYSPEYKWDSTTCSVTPTLFGEKSIKVAMIREEGINGDREMGAALHLSGFQVWDVTMQDMLDSDFDLESFQGVVFPGGFSYGDVLGASKGWAASITFNAKAKTCLQRFISRPDTFVLGVCNGCQLMATVGLIGERECDQHGRLQSQEVSLERNTSGRFESRFSTVRIEQSPSIFFKDMAGFVLGVWVAHGEGRFNFSNDEVLDKLERHHLIPIRYVGERSEPTMLYPFNPNGSPHGIAGICSPDGRRLALMPHPERCFLPWQWPHWRDVEKPRGSISPWLLFFRNAYNWCCQTVNGQCVNS